MQRLKITQKTNGIDCCNSGVENVKVYLFIKEALYVHEGAVERPKVAASLGMLETSYYKACNAL
jgi:hypothetical protein